MERKLIKADGTIYANFRGRPVRIVETTRLWDQGLGRYGSAPYIKPSTFEKMSGSSRPAGYGNRSYTGFLTVVGSNTPEAMADLADLAIPKTGDGVWLDAWKQSLPETLTVEVLVSREITQTWDAYLEQCAVQRVHTAQVAAQRQERKDAMVRVLGRFKNAGLKTVGEDSFHKASYPGSPPRVSIAVSDLERYVDAHDMQRILDAVACVVTESFSTDDPKVGRILQKIQGSAETIRQRVSDEIALESIDTTGETRS